MPSPQIILLNGISSAGKSSIAKALQKSLDTPYLHVCIDTFEEMVPGRKDEGGEFASHSVFNKMLSGFHHSIAALALCGNNLIVDHVLVEGEEPSNWLPECLTLLTPFDVFFVGVRCSLEELERRETERGDRPTGLSRWQFDRMHRQVVYDFEVDTTVNSAEECAARIKAALSQSSPFGVAATLKLHEETC
jgi:chloramphenicol 3-O phosphotransferase